MILLRDLNSDGIMFQIAHGKAAFFGKKHGEFS
jgi:hypothetical protein